MELQVELLGFLLEQPLRLLLQLELLEIQHLQILPLKLGLPLIQFLQPLLQHHYLVQLRRLFLLMEVAQLFLQLVLPLTQLLQLFLLQLVFLLEQLFLLQFLQVALLQLLPLIKALQLPLLP